MTTVKYRTISREYVLILYQIVLGHALSNLVNLKYISKT